MEQEARRKEREKERGGERRREDREGRPWARLTILYRLTAYIYPVAARRVVSGTDNRKEVEEHLCR